MYIHTAKYCTCRMCIQYIPIMLTHVGPYCSCMHIQCASYYIGASLIFCLKPADGFTVDVVNIAKRCPEGVIDRCFMRYLLK